MLMLLFHLGDSQYAIPVTEVVEVTPRVALEVITRTPDYVAGLFNYRGRHVPVIDLRQVLQGCCCRNSFTTRTILVNFLLAAGGSRTLGLLAEHVTETMEVDPAAFTTTGLKVPGAPYLGRATRSNADLIQRISVANLLHGKPLRRSTSTSSAIQRPPVGGDIPLIAIGASTGGPSALCRVLRALPPNPGVAIAIVQHVDEQFVASFTRWLEAQVPLKVRAVRPGEPPIIDTVVVCGREDHLILRADGRLHYSPEPRALAYRPSVDVFFHSLAENQKTQTVGVLLTGMGKDGAAGLKAMRERNWCTIVQDQASCAVYGMPKAAIELGAAREILPLENIGPRLVAWAEQASSRGGGQRTRL